MASSTVALSLLMATPALAHSNLSVNASGETDIKSGLHRDSSVNKSDGIKKDKKDKKDNDREDSRDKRNANKQAFLAAIGAANAGIVTSVNGSTFLLNSFGKNDTTTVTTDASTVYKVNGVATTSAALSAKSRVIVFGTTSSTGINASIVSILNIGRGFFKHFFR